MEFPYLCFCYGKGSEIQWLACSLRCGCRAEEQVGALWQGGPQLCSSEAGKSREGQQFGTRWLQRWATDGLKKPWFRAVIEGIVSSLKLFWFVFMRFGFLHLAPYSSVTATSDWTSTVIQRHPAGSPGWWCGCSKRVESMRWMSLTTCCLCWRQLCHRCCSSGSDPLESSVP